MKPLHQAAAIACFLTGIWLGVRAGVPPQLASADPEHNASAAASGSAKPSGGLISSSTGGGKPSSPNAAAAAKKKATGQAKKSALEDLRQLLDTDFYHTHLEALFHRYDKIVELLPLAELPVAAAMLWEHGRRQRWALIILLEVTRRWGKEDPKAALAWIKTLDGNETMVFHLREGILGSLGETSPQLLWEEISQTQEWMDDRWIGSGMVGRYFGKDPELAKRFLASITDPGVRDLAAQAAVGALAEHDPQAALAWARSFPDSRAKENAVSRAFGALAESDPEAALAALRAQGSDIPASARERLLSKLVEKHPERAREFILSGGLKAGTQQEAEALARGLADRSPGDSALLASIPAGAARDAFLGMAAQRLAGSGDLDAAWGLIQKTQPGLERQSAMQGYSAAKTDKSVAEATTWLATLPAGHDRDSAIRGFVNQAASKNPQAACEWAAAMTDPIYRQDMLEWAVSAWHNRDTPAGAEAWLTATTTISPAEKERLMREIKKP